MVSIVFGCAGIVSSLIKEDLIDEYHLFVNPTAIGNGMTIFKSLDRTQKFSVMQSRFYSCGISVLSCKPKNDWQNYAIRDTNGQRSTNEEMIDSILFG